MKRRIPVLHTSDLTWWTEKSLNPSRLSTRPGLNDCPLSHSWERKDRKKDQRPSLHMTRVMDGGRPFSSAPYEPKVPLYSGTWFMEIRSLIHFFLLVHQIFLWSKNDWAATSPTAETARSTWTEDTGRRRTGTCVFHCYKIVRPKTLLSG